MYPNTPQMGGLSQLGQRQMQPPMNQGPLPPHMQPMGQPRPASQMGGMMQGYLASGGPAIGSEPWKQARQDGQHPFMDWFRSQQPQWGQGMGGHTAPNMQPWNQPRTAQGSSFGQMFNQW